MGAPWWRGYHQALRAHLAHLHVIGTATTTAPGRLFCERGTISIYGGARGTRCRLFLPTAETTAKETAPRSPPNLRCGLVALWHCVGCLVCGPLILSICNTSSPNGLQRHRAIASSQQRRETSRECEAGRRHASMPCRPSCSGCRVRRNVTRRCGKEARGERASCNDAEKGVGFGRRCGDGWDGGSGSTWRGLLYRSGWRQ
jgi:hypothetical protein